jgi:myosin heavy subunit
VSLKVIVKCLSKLMKCFSTVTVTNCLTTFISPPEQKKPNIFTPVMVHEQLVYSGAMEAVAIRQAGYPLRIEFEQFLAR